LMQPECEYLKTHPYFLGLCRSNMNQVSVQCTVNAMPPSPWSVWGTCVGANGLKCASVPGEMGTYFRTRFEGCGNYCAQNSQQSTCQLPVIPDIVTQTPFVETQCAAGTNLGLMESVRTIKNGCTGAARTEVVTKGVDISTLMVSTRYVRRQVKQCAKNIQCGRVDVTREEFEIYDKCTKTTTIEYGNACPVTACPYFSAWQSWESCSKSCGTGTMRRIRYCVGGEVGDGFCVKGTDGSLTVQTASCNRGECCDWEWSGWTGCCYNQARSRAVRYRFQLACGADQVTGIQGDCYTSQQDNYAQATAQADATAVGGMAVATATAGSSRAIASCDNIGTDINVWRSFHNPDKMQFSGTEFRVTGELKVDMSDPTFAAVSRAYMSASSSWKFATNIPQITTGGSWQYYGGNTLNFPFGSNGYSTGTATTTAGASASTNVGGAVVGASAGANASSSSMGSMGSMVGHAVGSAVGTSAAASANAVASSSSSASGNASASSSANSSTGNTVSGGYMPQRNNLSWLWGK